MPIIKPQARKQDTAALALRIDEPVAQQLELYSQYLSSTRSYIVTEALRAVFASDKEFQKWLASQSGVSVVERPVSNGNGKRAKKAVEVSA